MIQVWSFWQSVYIPKLERDRRLCWPCIVGKSPLPLHSSGGGLEQKNARLRAIPFHPGNLAYTSTNKVQTFSYACICSVTMFHIYIPDVKNSWAWYHLGKPQEQPQDDEIPLQWRVKVEITQNDTKFQYTDWQVQAQRTSPCCANACLTHYHAPTSRYGTAGSWMGPKLVLKLVAPTTHSTTTALFPRPLYMTKRCQLPRILNKPSEWITVILFPRQVYLANIRAWCTHARSTSFVK